MADFKGFWASLISNHWSIIFLYRLKFTSELMVKPSTGLVWLDKRSTSGLLKSKPVGTFWSIQQPVLDWNRGKEIKSYFKIRTRSQRIWTEVSRGVYLWARNRDEEANKIFSKPPSREAKKPNLPSTKLKPESRMKKSLAIMHHLRLSRVNRGEAAEWIDQILQ